MITLIITLISLNGVELLREEHDGYPSIAACVESIDGYKERLAPSLEGMKGIKINGVPVNAIEYNCVGGQPPIPEELIVPEAPQ